MNSLTGADKEIPQEIICHSRIIKSKNTSCGCCIVRRSFTVTNHKGEPEKIKVVNQEYNLIEKLLCCYLFNYYCDTRVECSSLNCCECSSCGSCDCDCDYQSCGDCDCDDD